LPDRSVLGEICYFSAREGFRLDVRTMPQFQTDRKYTREKSGILLGVEGTEEKGEGAGTEGQELKGLIVLR